MSENTQIIELVQIKSWYIPADAQSYEVLRGIGVPLLKIHKDFVPTLQLVTRPRNIRARVRPFKDMLHAKLDDIGEKWKARKGRSCKMTDDRLSFSAPMTEDNKKKIAQLDVSFARFFARWGYSYTAMYSEVNGRMKLVADYAFDPSRNPVVDSKQVEPTQAFEIVLGFTKFRLTFRDRPETRTTVRTRVLPPIIHFEVFTQIGSDWKQVHTGTCVDSQIGDPTQLLSALSLLFDRRKLQEA